MDVDKNYFPGFVRKAITFTNDDGNLVMDKKFIDILKPYGIKGTFNICGKREGHTAEEYINLYEGFGIANHCCLHPFAFSDKIEYKISDKKFNKETSDESYIYQHETYKDVFHFAKAPATWRLIATGEKYIALVAECQKVIEEIFGKGLCVSFVWPYCEQDNSLVNRYLKKNFRSVRKVGATEDKDDFSLPKDRYAWSYNATHMNLLNVAEKFERYEDDGELKFFSFGVHSVDYENANKWGDLVEFAERYGNRPNEYYYASVDDIFDYEDAVNSLIIEENIIINNSNLTLYIKVDGEPVVLSSGATFAKSK